MVSAESDVRDASEERARILRRDLAVTVESSGMMSRDAPMRAIRGAPPQFDILQQRDQL